MSVRRRNPQMFYGFADLSKNTPTALVLITEKRKETDCVTASTANQPPTPLTVGQLQPVSPLLLSPLITVDQALCVRLHSLWRRSPASQTGCLKPRVDQYASELFPSSYSRENNYWTSEPQYMYLAELRRASVRSLTQLWQCGGVAFTPPWPPHLALCFLSGLAQRESSLGYRLSDLIIQD
ncbi:unnamed protein product [Leuciscus chuanchicus]